MTWLRLAGLLLVLVVANGTIWQRQAIVDHGQPLLLKLRPVDPRSLMQGDYMDLAYDDSLFPPAEAHDRLPSAGRFVVTVDEDNVARFARLDDGRPLAADERYLAFRLVDRQGRIRLGAESFFFQEGRADDFAGAEYGVLHVDKRGRPVLVGLADADRQLID